MALVYPHIQLSEVVEEHPSLIPMINRFGIRLGLGDKSVKMVCEAHGLDPDFLLTVINTYLNIERHLQSFIQQSAPDNPSLTLIGKFFHSFKTELMARIQQDDTVWFPRCLTLCQQLESLPLPIAYTPAPEVEEDRIEALLADLKRILIRHLAGDYNENLCYAVIFALSSLEKDIKQHNRIRYRILMPMVTAMEQLNAQ